VGGGGGGGGVRAGVPLMASVLEVVLEGKVVR
jgi:hypothetical protein